MALDLYKDQKIKHLQWSTKKWSRSKRRKSRWWRTEPRPYDDMLTAEEFGLLFEESDDENFDGFWSATIIKTAPLGATKYCKKNDRLFLHLLLAYCICVVFVPCQVY